jgi:hypothetical protein
MKDHYREVEKSRHSLVMGTGEGYRGRPHDAAHLFSMVATSLFSALALIVDEAR